MTPYKGFMLLVHICVTPSFLYSICVFMCPGYLGRACGWRSKFCKCLCVPMLNERATDMERYYYYRITIRLSSSSTHTDLTHSLIRLLILKYTQKQTHYPGKLVLRNG